MRSVPTGQREDSIEPCSGCIEPFCRHPEDHERARHPKRLICASLLDEPLHSELKIAIPLVELLEGSLGVETSQRRACLFGESQ